MFSVVSEPCKELRVGLASGIYTLNDAAEERRAAQKAFGVAREGGGPLNAYEAALAIQEQYLVKDEAQEAADRQKEEEQRGLRERRETDEILTLQQMLPELLQGNRRLLRLLAQYEEGFLMQCCELPLEFKIKALQVPEAEDSPAEPKGIGGPLEAVLQAPEAPVTIARQGRHVAAFANRRMNPGDLIFKEKPFVCTPVVLESGQVFSSCFHCLQERQDPSQAFSCPVSPNTCPFVFCSCECLMKNARLHAVECTCMPLIFAAAKESRLSVTFVLHLFRVLVKASLQREAQLPPDNKIQGETDTFNGDVVTQIFSLNAFEEEVRKGQPELLQKIQLLLRRLQQSIPPNMLLYLTEKELLHVALVVLQYSPYVSATSAAAAVQRRDPDCTLGQVFAPAAAMLHHSCVPTATVTLGEDGRVAVRALTQIPPGGYICVSAEEDLFKTQRERKAVEALPRVFGCGCIRCRENDEGGRLLRGIRCFKCIRGFLCPLKDKGMLARLKAYGETGLSRAVVSSNTATAKTAPQETPGDNPTTGKTVKTPPKHTSQQSAKDKEEGPPDAPPLQEQWLCSCCGLTGQQTSKVCEEMERDIAQRQTKADAHLLQGARQLAARCYSDLVELYGSKLHPQHSVLFNANTILAGLLAAQGGKELPRALIILRRASMAAETVLPATSMVKVHLYLKLAELTYRTMQLEKQCRRGPPIPPEKILNPLFCALWNCVACKGREATLSVTVGLRLRRFAALLGVSTPPLTHFPVVRTDEQIRKLFMQDPVSIAAGLVRRGVHFPLALELYKAMKDIQHLPTGLSLLGLACLYAQDAVVNAMLKMGYNLFAQCPLGMTPLLVMCASRASHLPSGRKGTVARCVPSAAAAAAATAVAETEMEKATETARLTIFRLMLQHCDSLDAHEALLDRHRPLEKRQSPSPSSSTSTGTEEETATSQDTAAKPKGPVLGPSRRRLLFASAHRLLGRSQALHFAASNNKTRLCRQMLAAGAEVEALNIEGATPLHLACVSGALDTVKLLVERGADINAPTLAGETPLLLAGYWLRGDILSWLLQKGANPKAVTRAEGLTVLHAVAAGVLRQTRPLFRGLAWEGDPAAITLEGVSAEAVARGTYTRGGVHPESQDALIDLRFPSATSENSEMLVFPEELMERVQKAHNILLSLVPHCDPCTYTRRTRRGFTAADLLLHSWEDFEGRRNGMLKVGDLRLAPLTTEEKQQLEERWHFVLHKIYILRDLLRPQALEGTEGDTRGDCTPRPEQMKEAEHQKMLAVAPWLFPDEVARANGRVSKGPLAMETAAGG
ncbi:ankyrin repeat-containing protein, conserved, putative [Eimeria praecox]|uniref:Ankyrin repeat-containing protein, conserved, putative n=1 Tax=Eimeria praecox TaxID=51316 RepID=U6H1G3_9EIME|nr:ankyrin repeat-containing protein, conserved, putative [Eimeria praecox]